MVVAPHHLAAEAGASVLRDGGNAIEAMVAAAAAIAVVYPHMNGLGGDNFWLISKAGQPPVGIDACGAAAQLASPAFYRERGFGPNEAAPAIPSRGPLAALTAAGAISGWRAALELSKTWGGHLPLSRLFEDAIHHAKAGAPVTATQHNNTRTKRAELEPVRGFADLFLPDGQVPATGVLFTNVKLASTLAHLASTGLDDFYRGELARGMARELELAGSPLRLADFEAHAAQTVAPLKVKLKAGRVYGMPPPTQGLASLMILGIFDQLRRPRVDSFAYVHGLVEASKRAFIVRDAHVTDPLFMTADPSSFLTRNALANEAKQIDPKNALPWPHVAKPGDTVWLGAIDRHGNAVSFIQSVYWEFGSGLVLPSSGIVWQNRGTSFALDETRQNALKPGRKPFHTIQPAMALLEDGRIMPYGTMGGEGQPQTQAMIFTRHVLYGQDLQQAINAPRWLLGRTWGNAFMNLRLESRFPPRVVASLREAGHEVAVVGPFDETMGHAGALVLHRNGAAAGVIEGAADPRGDGRAAGF